MVAEKIDDYYTRCRLAGFDARSGPVLNRSLEDYQAIARESLSEVSALVTLLPPWRRSKRR